MRKNLRIEDVTALIDTREKLIADLSPLKTQIQKLDTGDYSAKGLENQICVERKGLQDLVQCVTFERARFERCIKRMRDYRFRAIFIEADWSQLDLKQYRGSTNPLAIQSSLMSWAGDGISIILGGDRARTGLLIARFIWNAANRMHREKSLESESSAVIQEPTEEKTDEIQ